MSRTNRLRSYATLRTRLTCQVLESRETPAAFVVNDTGNGGDDDLDDPDALDANGKTTLRAAIEQGNDDGGSHTITFSATTFPAPGDYIIPVAGTQFKLDANFTITGPTAATITLQPVYTAVFPLQPVKFRIMEIDAASTSTIKNLRFSGADFPAGMGGAIYNAGNLTLEDCSIVGCKAASGGGIANLNTLAVKTSLIDGNQAPTGDGGGIYCAPVAGSVTTVTSSQISNNQASKEPRENKLPDSSVMSGDGSHSSIPHGTRSV
jgi:hypothetical protein